MKKPDLLLLDRRMAGLVSEYMPPGNVLEGLVEFFGVFADFTRIRIISALAISPMCVNDLAVMLDLNQTTVSHQLRNMRAAGIVRAKRQGKMIFYSLASQAINDVMLNGVEYLGY